jgi:alpha-L-fucosidase
MIMAGKKRWIKRAIVFYLTVQVCFVLSCSYKNAQISNVKTSVDVVRTSEQDMQWWRESRFGLFIHWGPVSLKGTEIGWSRGREIPIEVYDNLYKEFNPAKFDAAEWVSIAKAAGTKYIVITSKHHDGFAIFDSKYTDYDIMSTPFKKDVIKELSRECKKQKIKLCFYHSIIDWHHPDYLPRGAGDKRPASDAVFERYVSYMKNQLRELLTNYGPIGILWFDGEWDPTWTHEQGKALYAYVKDLQPHIIINNRVGKGRAGMEGTTEKGEFPGDYDTPEQQIGKFNADRPWESCITICQQWAWKPNDQLKSLKECIRTLVNTAGGDGNLLLNVGPMPDGRIEPRQVERLKEMGDWLKKYGQTIYSTRGGPFKPGSWGASTHKKNTIYLHILNWSDDTITLPAISKKIIASSVLTGGKAVVKQTKESIEISVPKTSRDSLDTIIILKLDGDAGDIPACDVPPESLAAKKKATASNVFENRAEHGPDKAVDDDPSTRWATDYGIKQAWLEVDLGKSVTFNRVKISESYERVEEFELQYKNGDRWQTFLQDTKIGPEFSKQFDSVTAQYVRLNILQATEGPTIWEFGVFAPKK